MEKVKTGKIEKSNGWYTASFKVKAGTLSKDFRSLSEAKEFLAKYNQL